LVKWMRKGEAEGGCLKRHSSVRSKRKKVGVNGHQKKRKYGGGS